MNTNETQEDCTFSKKSKHDKMTTANLKELTRNGVMIVDAYGNMRRPDTLWKGDKFILSIGGYDCVWEVNRDGESARTHGFPFRKPAVGRPARRKAALKGRIV